MAAKNTVNVQRMQAAATELENIYASMTKQMKTLDENISTVKRVWTGDAANTYLKQYEKNVNAFNNMAKAIKSASQALIDSCNTYDQAEGTAMDIVQKMGKR
ncbi:MAG: WXG100 family type VII secretion target [Lachnospiraceae bacterium]|nr:WXG100 family type VII secretion target [Lachnospiraceae bacterium]